MKGLGSFARAEAWSVLVLMTGATILAAACAAWELQSHWAGPLAAPILLAPAIWRATIIGLLPLTLLLGGPGYLLTRRLRFGLSLVIPAAAVLSAAWISYPLSNRCEVSLQARARLLRTLSADEAHTLISPPTLSDDNRFCPLHFQFIRRGHRTDVDALDDLIHGTKLYFSDEPSDAPHYSAPIAPMRSAMNSTKARTFGARWRVGR